MNRFGAVLAFAWVLLLAAAVPVTASSFAGLPITSITIQDDQARPWPSPEHVTGLIVVRPGTALSGESIREGISYLYLTGKFRDIRVDGFPDQGGVRLVYTLVPVTVVSSIAVSGNHALSRSSILDAFKGVEGKELREDRFPDLRSALLALYQSDGYYGVQVDFSVQPGPRPHEVVLAVAVREPKRTVIGDVTFTGNTVFPKRQLVKDMQNRPGKPLRTDVLFDKDMAAIVEKYTEAGYPVAKPGPVDISFREGQAFLTIGGTEGPKVTVSFGGNHAVSDGDLEKQVLIWTEHDISDAIVDGTVDKIRALYREKGYEEVKVTVKRTEAADRIDLHFDIQEGIRVTVKQIAISGNSWFKTGQLTEEMSLREPGWFSSSPFRQDLLDKDVDAIRGKYQDAGFLQAEVKKSVDLVDNGTHALVWIVINEGPQTRTGTIRFEGSTVFTEAQLLDKVNLKPETPFTERLIEEDRYRILSAYSDRGYLYARVEPERKTAGGTVDITYRITEDKPVRVGAVILRGNESTRESVIRRELLLKPGDAYNYEKILKSQQRLYRFGYFTQVRFEPVNPGEKEYVKDMLLTLEERPAGAVEVGVGYGDLDRARAFLELSHRNMWGIAHYAGVRFEKSDILTRSILNYQHPWFFGYDLQGKFALTWYSMKHVNSDTREIYYETRQTSAAYGVEKKIDTFKASLTYAFENVENFNVEEGAILSPQDVGHVRISSFSPALVWDLRDDIFNPRKGALYGAVLKEARHEIGSSADFTKLSLQSSWYVPVTDGVVTALSARAGKAWPHNETVEVPLHERFYLGGSTTVRGYTQDSVGPLVNGTPTGGSSMLLLNAEVRIMALEGFGVVVFSDAGNVWVDQAIRVNDLRASYGAGIRYGTPVGPLRIDYGQKIHRRPGESPGELQFNIGHTF